MEPWLIFGGLAYLSYGVSCAIDKYFMKNGYEPISTTLFKMFFDGAVLLILGLLFFGLHITIELFLWSLLLGTLYGLSGILYFSVLKTKNVEVVIPFFQSFKILLIFVSAIFLFKEIVNFSNVIGLMLILIGIYAVLSGDGIKFPKLDKGIGLIGLMVLMHVVYALLAKKLLSDVQPIDLAIMLYFSATLVTGLYILFSKKQRARFDIKSSKIVISAVFGGMGTFLLFTALTTGKASKVFSLAGLQSVTVFLLAMFFLKEKFYAHRLFGILSVFLGIYLISF